MGNIVNPASPAKTREQLKYEKALLQLDDLRQCKVRTYIQFAQAVLTFFLTIAVAAGGWILQERTDTRSAGEKAVEHADALYYNALHDFDSTNASERAGGTRGILAYVTPNKGGELTDDRAKQALLILVTRLTAETDPAALNVLETSVSSAGSAALPGVTEANRRASLDFARSFGHYFGLTLRGKLRARHALDQPQIGDDVATILRAQFAGGDPRYAALVKLARSMQESAVRHVEQLSLPVNAEKYYISPRQLLAVRRLEDQVVNEASNTVNLDDEAARDDKVSTALADLDRRALALVATSNTLAYLLEATQASPSRTVSLRDVVLLSTTLDGKDLSGADLREAYVSGSALKLHCTYCDLRGAYLDQIVLAGSDLTGSDVEGARLRDFGKVPPDVAVRDVPVLDGVNWWAATFGGALPAGRWVDRYQPAKQSAVRRDLRMKYLALTPNSSLRQAYRGPKTALPEVDATRVSVAGTSRT